MATETTIRIDIIAVIIIIIIIDIIVIINGHRPRSHSTLTPAMAETRWLDDCLCVAVVCSFPDERAGP